MNKDRIIITSVWAIILIVSTWLMVFMPVDAIQDDAQYEKDIGTYFNKAEQTYNLTEMRGFLLEGIEAAKNSTIIYNGSHDVILKSYEREDNSLYYYIQVIYSIIDRIDATDNYTYDGDLIIGNPNLDKARDIHKDIQGCDKGISRIYYRAQCPMFKDIDMGVLYICGVFVWLVTAIIVKAKIKDECSW